MPSPPNAPRGSDVESDEDVPSDLLHEETVVEDHLNKKLPPNDTIHSSDDLQPCDQSKTRPGSPPQSRPSNVTQDRKSIFGKGRASLNLSGPGDSGPRKGKSMSCISTFLFRCFALTHMSMSPLSQSVNLLLVAPVPLPFFRYTKFYSSYLHRRRLFLSSSMHNWIKWNPFTWHAKRKC